MLSAGTSSSFEEAAPLSRRLLIRHLSFVINSAFVIRASSFH
jgi:hypothetical protein